jgi:hypothetical protein
MVVWSALEWAGCDRRSDCLGQFHNGRDRDSSVRGGNFFRTTILELKSPELEPEYCGNWKSPVHLLYS